MVLSRLRFFRRGLTTAVFREFGKVPERSEAFTTSKRSASKQLSTLLKKVVGSVSRAGWRFKMLYYFFQNFAINCFKNRHSHFFLRLLSNLCDLCITGRCANLLPDITDLLWKEGSKLIAFAVREHFTGNLTWGFVSLSTVVKRVRVLFKLLFIRFEKKVCLAVASSKLKAWRLSL